MQHQLVNASILTIGDELLIGQTLDTNSQWLAAQLTTMNINVISKMTCSDAAADIHACMSTIVDTSDIIILTGGLGPTNDDVTKDVLCALTNTTLTEDPTVLRHIQHLLSNRGLDTLPANRAQALIPDGATVLFNRLGTAPGLLLNHKHTWIVALPGVPFEMRTIFEEELLPRLKSTFRPPALIHSYITTVDIPESRLAAQIADIEATLPSDIKLAYLPSYGMVRLRLTLWPGQGASHAGTVSIFTQLLIDRIGEQVISTNEDSLATILKKLATMHRLKIGTVESCTGGGIGSAITDVPGASSIYMGSIVAYDNIIKNELLQVSNDTLQSHGAVSESTVIQMAQHGASILKADLVLAVSGILGPQSDDTNKPVGLVYMGIFYNGKTKVYRNQFNGDRKTNKERAIALGLIHLIQFIAKVNTQH